MKCTAEAISLVKALKEEPAPRGAAGFHLVAWLCGLWQRYVYGERSMYLSR
jgi:hypothetical protein